MAVRRFRRKADSRANLDRRCSRQAKTFRIEDRRAPQRSSPHDLHSSSVVVPPVRG
jgi:hypothetical protein